MNRLIVPLLSCILFSCTSKVVEEKKEAKSQSEIHIEKEEIIQVKAVVDSFVLVYNSLPPVKFYNSYFMMGDMSYKDGVHYPVYFEKLADQGSPDSIQDAYLDSTERILTIYLGDYVMNLSYFKDFRSNSLVAVVRTNSINQLYGVDSYMHVFKADSLFQWKDITTTAIDKKNIFAPYTTAYTPRYELNDLFFTDYKNSGKVILLRINTGKRKWECDGKKNLICTIKESQLKDSLRLEWNSDSARFITK